MAQIGVSRLELQVSNLWVQIWWGEYVFHTGKNFTTDVLGEGKRTKLGGTLSNLIVSDSIERN